MLNVLISIVFLILITAADIVLITHIIADIINAVRIAKAEKEWEAFLAEEDEEEADEEPMTDFSSGLYDVNAFRERMDALRKVTYENPDEDGLYDVFVTDNHNEYTGTEVPAEE